MLAEATLDNLARPSGALAMVALDQRESLRTLFEKAGVSPATDELLATFKNEAATTLAAHASAILLDPGFGGEAIRHAQKWPPTCALIVAADRLEQRPGEAPTDSTLDESFDAGAARSSGAAALKLLVYWRGAENATACQTAATRFLELCRKHGLLAILEGVVQPPRDGSSWDREEAIIDAARELGACKPDIYKAEVPLYGKAASGEVTARAERISAAVGCPWVVLSNGVPSELFADAVRASCRGGASGFLAGRAIWADTVTEGAYREHLLSKSLPRLEQLTQIVDEEARPWPDASVR